MLISRNVESPAAIIRGNRIDRTPGFYGHTPKFWSCRNYDFDAGWRKFGETKPAWWDAHTEEARAGHARCRWPFRHLSASGYVAYVFPRKGRLTLWYLGRSPNPTQRRLNWQPDFRRKFADRGQR